MDAGSRAAAPAGGRGGLIAAFLAGVLLVQLLPVLPPPWTALPPLLALPWLGRWRLPLLVFVLAAGSTLWRAEQRLHERWPAARHGEDVALRAWVSGLPERQGSDWRFVIAHREAALPQRIRVSWYRSEQRLRAGQCWDFRLRLRTPRGSLNPGGFDYERWLFAGGFGATAYVRQAERCTGADRLRGLHAWRQSLVDRLEILLPDHPGLPLLKALLVGDRSGLDQDAWRTLRISGTAHLLAISGLHIALVAGFAFACGRWGWSVWPRLCLLWPAQRVGTAAALLAAAAYAALAGFSVPTLRALLMLAVFALAMLWGRGGAPFLALGVAAVAVLALDPFAVLTASFWLSFGAVAAILYAVAGRAGAPARVPAFLRLQLLLGLLLVPMSLAFFDGASLLSPLVNLLAVPLFALLLPLLLVAAVLALAVPAALAPLALLAGALARAFDGLQALVALWPHGWLVLAPAPAAVLLSAAGAALLAAPRGLPLRLSGLLLCLPLALPPRHAPAQGFTLTALDVGQGLAVVVRTQNHALLYDAGPAYDGGFDAGESIVVPYLHASGLRRLDRLVLSHGDNDHAGGLAAVRRAMPVTEEIGTVRPCAAGEQWRWDGVRFSMLHPPAGRADGSDNNRSCVLRIDGPYGSALLAGDIEREAEARLLAAAAPLAAEVLVAPHHGSRSSSTPAFVRAVAPKLVIFSAGWRHHFGHPHAQVVERYRSLGAQTLTTGVEGAIGVALDGRDAAPLRWRAQAARYWNAPAEP